ncbi:MAG: protease HtpX [Candidatus Cloacimonadaceae bacterium]|nr:protease HtpX [Candidatus Cloacimonadaceae bacterium]MDP3113770.1 protease HtpX [Candidatus Cloacimonadaceae bacterium]
MTGLKRFGIFIITNLLVMMVISVILSLINIPMDQLWGLLAICAIFGFAGSFISLWTSKFAVKLAYKVKLVKPEEASGKARFLYDTIEKMAAFEKIKMPEVGIYPSQDANAFATGATRNSSLIAFSSGLLDNLSEEEIAAVAGHEMTHITQGDMVTMTLLMGLVNTFVMFLARVLAFALDVAMRDKNGRGGLGFFGYFIVVMLLQNVLFLLAYIPICSYSRFREYRADGGAARLTGAANMINALEKIGRLHVPEKKTDAYATAKINNTRKASLYATHPAMKDRIERLRKMI